MRNIHKLLLLAIISLSASGLHGGIPEKTDTLFMGKSELFYSHSSLVNPWNLGRNPAGLIFNMQEKISRFRLQYENNDNNIRRAMDPRQTRVFSVNTHNFQSLGKARVSGSFGYQNAHYGGLLYNGNMDFRYMNIYMLGDTVGGPQRQEGYNFTTALAYPLLGERLTGGIRLDYESTIGAKMKDLRNRNTITRTNINAGLIYNSGAFAVGLSGGSVIENNLTDVNAQLDERHTLFYHMGMGNYSASINFSTSESVLYEGRGYTGGFQIRLKKRDWNSFHSADYFHLKTEARVGSNYRLINGITDYNRITYTGDLQIKKILYYHRLMLKARMAKTFATEVRQESYPQNIDGVFYTMVRTLRWIEGKHIVNDLAGGLSYNLTRLGTFRPFKFQLTAEAGGGYYSATHYPAETYGYYNSSNMFSKLGYQHFLTWGNVNIDPLVEMGMRIIMQKEAQFIPFPNYLEKIPELDYRFFSESYYLAAFGIDLSTSKVAMKRISEFFVKIRGDYAAFPGIESEKNYNLSIKLSLGTIF